jgi:hypothetical protein
MKVPVNLATKPMETNRRFVTLCGTLIALLALPFPWLVWHVRTVRRADAAFRIQNETSTREIDSLISQREELDRFFTLPENAKLHDRAAFINSIIDAQSLNWTHMFLGLASVRLTVGAMTEDAKRDFISSLERSDAFSKVQLVNVRMTAPGAVGDPIILELTVVYSGT